VKSKGYVTRTVTRQMTNFTGCKARNTSNRLIPQSITTQDAGTPVAHPFSSSSLCNKTFLQDLPPSLPQAAQLRKQSYMLFSNYKSPLLQLNTVSAPLPLSPKKHAVKEHIFT